MLRRIPGRGFRARFIAPLALAGAGALLMSGSAPAADRFEAGQVGVTRTPLSGDDARRATARAVSDGAALGLPAATRQSASAVANRFLGRSYVDVTSVDAAGSALALVRYDRDGRLQTAIRFGWPAPGLGIAGGLATDRARALAATAGMVSGGSATTKRTPDGGFAVTWPRTVDGVPVTGDGVRVVLWADGSLHSISREEHALAQAPATRLGRADAEQRADAQLTRWLAPTQRASARVDGVELAWVAPNDMFVPAGPDAPGTVLRLAWVATVRRPAS